MPYTTQDHEIDLKKVTTAFANMALLNDNFPSHTGPPGASLEQILKDPSSKESIFLLATYCFDLERRFGYLYRVLQQVTMPAVPNMRLAKRVAKDTAAINDPNTWEKRAEAAYRAMVKVHKGVKAERAARMKHAKKRGVDADY